MIRAVKISRSAERDLRQAFDWYEHRRAGLGQALLDETERAARLIARYPDASVKVHRNLRRILLRRFPFAMFYSFDESNVLIHAVLHCRREPARWSVNEAVA